MAERVAYITVRLDIANPEIEEITDEQLDNIITEVNYEFSNVGSFEIDTEICGIND